ncbi:MAG: signal recognition particle-docking protein FtsY [Planctomycetes bacterium]|nr:signal recognition particle-docking protein FtsY [Planctomycetota bacterium]
MVRQNPERSESGSRSSLFGKLRDAVSKTRKVFSRRVATIVGLGQKIDEDLLEELEEALLESDIGVDTCEYLMVDLRQAWKAGEIDTTDDIFPFLKADLKHRLSAKSSAIMTAESGPTVILVVGVNGAGKTTSIAKMARIFVKEGKKVLLAAGDTFRAAAVQQLVTWSTRIGCEIVTGEDGADPASVAFKACTKAVEERYDILLIDTAGRLHTQKDLMDELAKITRVIQKQVADAPHEAIMVIDATTGQNAVQQAKLFKETAAVTGIFLAKLDGTAKGGAVLTIDRAVGIPVKFVGLGETFEDVQRFNAHAFVDALFDESLGVEAG